MCSSYTFVNGITIECGTVIGVEYFFVFDVIVAGSVDLFC